MNKKTLIIFLVLLFGLSVGYYLGFDHGFEKAVKQFVVSR